MGAVGQRVLASGFLSADGDLHFLLNAAWVYYSEFNTLAPLDVLCRELHDHWIELSQARGREIFPASYLVSYREVLTQWYCETSWADAWCQQWIMDYLQRYEAQRLSGSLQGLDDLDKIKQVYESADAILRGDPFVNLHEQSAWNDIWAAMHEDERMKLGIGFIDNALDGGMAPKECALLVAPSGGGKTTIGMQMAAYRVARHSHIIYLSTEQALEGDMAMRQAMLGAQTTRSQLKKGKKAAPPELIARLDAVAHEWSTYFHFVDCRKRRDNSTFRIEDLFSPIDRLISMGIQIDLVVLDWWGRLRNRMIMQMQSGSDSRARNASSDWLDTLIQGIKDRNSRLFVLHQLKGASAGKGAKAKVSTHDAQEDTNLNNLFEFGFAMGTMNADNEAFIGCDKARSSAKTEGYLVLDGDRGKFKTMDPTTATFEGTGAAPVRHGDIPTPDALTGGQV